MSMQLVLDIVIGLGLVGFLAYRQTTWQFVDPARVWRMPVVLGIIGVVTLANSGSTVTATDIAFLGIEVVVAIAVGLTMGRLTTFRTAAQPDDKGRTLQTRTGGLGAALWLVLIAVRIGLDLLGAHMGAELVTSSGAILVTLAVNRAARAVVVDQRIPKSHQVRA